MPGYIAFRIQHNNVALQVAAKLLVLLHLYRLLLILGRTIILGLRLGLVIVFQNHPQRNMKRKRQQKNCRLERDLNSHGSSSSTPSGLTGLAWSDPGRMQPRSI